MTFRVLMDRHLGHHGVLAEALAMLFEDRLGGELRVWQDGIYVTGDSVTADFPPRRPKVLTSSEAIAWEPDLVIATAGASRQRMRTLASECGARYVDHLGNAWDEPISSTILRSVSGDQGVLYHPEFHRVAWREPRGKRVASFHSSFEHSECRSFWDRASEAHPEYEWVMYGTSEHPLRPYEVAEAMQDCVAIWHCKDADGYGFAVHEAFASGRAVIGHARHYSGKLAGNLFVDGYVEPESYEAALQSPKALGMAARHVFESVVDFDAEAQIVSDYLVGVAA